MITEAGKDVQTWKRETGCEGGVVEPFGGVCGVS